MEACGNQHSRGSQDNHNVSAQAVHEPKTEAETRSACSVDESLLISELLGKDSRRNRGTIARPRKPDGVFWR
jgi:hypothetical protein